jgi:AbiV family abortive infection protein
MKKQWKTLTYPQIARGMVLCSMNAHRLSRGAAIALRNRSWAGAVFQSVLAMEEQGRLVILYAAYIGAIDIDEEWWRTMFRDHKAKIAWLATAFFIYKEQRKWTKTLRRLGTEFQALKEQAMYVDYRTEKGYWYHPGRIKKRKALEVFKTAAEFIKGTEALMSDVEDEANEGPEPEPTAK